MGFKSGDAVFGAGGADGAAYGLSLVGTEIVHDDDVARRQGGQELLDVSRESSTRGASIRSTRKAARKVSVRHRPYGALATKRWPRCARPWRRVMFVC